MSPRLAGSLLALTAAALLVVSIVTSAWWAGPPEVNGRVLHKKEVFVGMLGAKGCNTGGDGSCEPLELSGAFPSIGYAELGASGILVLGILLLALLTLTSSERRKGISTLVIGAAVLAAVVAVPWIVIGPTVKASAKIVVPIGYGMYLFWGGLAAAVLGSVLARRPAPKLELRSSRQPIAPGLAPPPDAQHVDVMALMPHDQLRPSSMGPEPQLRPSPVAPPPPPSPGGMLPGPAGPLGVGAPAPMFAGAPQLRPLYEVDPNFGGTGGYVPAPAAPLPRTGPQPIPRDQISAIAGIPTPPPMDVPVLGTQPPAPPRAKPVSVAPPIPPIPATPMTTERPKLPGLVPPPPGTRTKAASVVPPPRAKAPSLPPPARGKVPSIAPPAAAKGPTIGIAVVPPPAATPAPGSILPSRAETDPVESLQTIERDAATVDRTDASIELPDGGARAATESEDVQTEARPKVETSEVVATVARDSASEIETIARERFSASELATGDSTSPEGTPAAADEKARAKTPAPERAKTPAPERAKTPAPVVEPPASESKVNIPVSTAPDSLPPPKEQQAATSGPSPACPQCEAPMAWVEEHLRFYCKSCRMYF